MERSFELRELFHLHFLRGLSPRLAGRPYAVKGGICLRFFHQSPRLSEDIDLDVTSGIPLKTLQKVVDGVLQGAAMQASLRPYGIERLQMTRPKQTLTTPRWKTALIPAGGRPISTRVEFSRRQRTLESQSGIPGADILQRYALPPFAVRFYSAETMVAQKIIALAAPSRTAARDLFDLHHLFFHRSVDIPSDRAVKESLEPAMEKVRQFRYPDFRDQVLPFLPDDLAGHYAAASAFQQLRDQVEEKLIGFLV